MGLLGSLGSLNVLLSADTTQFSTAMDKAAFTAEKDLQRISSKSKMNSAIITAAMVAAATGVAVKIKQIIDKADEIGDKMAPALGMTAEQLSKLEYAAKISGVEIEELRSAFQRFNRTAFDETNGIVVNGVAGFKALGVTLKDNDGNLRSNYDIMLDVADALAGMSDGIGKAAVAQQLFGRSGSKMVPLLNQGSDGIKALGAEAERLGIVLDTRTATAAAAFNDNMTRLSQTVQGAFMSMTSAVIPTLLELSEEMTKSSHSMEGFTATGKALALILTVIANGLMTTSQILETTGKHIGDVAATIHFFATGKFKLAMEAMQDSSLETREDWIALSEAVTNNTTALNNALAGVADNAEGATSKIGKSVSKSSDILDKFAKQMVEGESLTKSLRTAQEKYNEDLEYYTTLLQGGAIDQETFSRATKKAEDTFRAQDEAIKKLNDTSKAFGTTIANSFETAIFEGQKFSEFLKGLLEDITRLAFNTLITKPLADGLSSSISGFFSPAKTTTATPTTASRHGNVFSFDKFATGGVINRPVTFPMANGGVGLAGEAGAEAILPLFRTGGGDLGVKAAMGGNVQVNVYAPEGSSVKQERETSGDMDKINIIIDDAMAGNIGNPGSKTYRTLKSSFGLKQALTKR